MVAFTALVAILIVVTALLVAVAHRKMPKLYALLLEWQTGLAALVALVGLGAGAFYADQVARVKEHRDALANLTVMRWEVYGLTFRAEEFVSYWGPTIEKLKEPDSGKAGVKLTKDNSISAYAIGEWSRLPERRVFTSLTTQVGAIPGKYVRDMMNYHLTVDLYERIAKSSVTRAVGGRLSAVEAKGILFTMNVICFSGQRLGRTLDAYLDSEGAAVSVPPPQATCTGPSAKPSTAPK